MIIHLPAFTQKRKSCRSYCCHCQACSLGGSTRLCSRPTASASATASAAPWMDLCLKEVSGHERRILPALKENINQQLAERVDKYIPCHLCCVCSLAPTLAYAWCSLCRGNWKSKIGLPEPSTGEELDLRISCSSRISLPQSVAEIARSLIVW